MIDDSDRLELWLHYATGTRYRQFSAVREEYYYLEEAWEDVQKGRWERLGMLSEESRARLREAAADGFMDRYVRWLDKNGVNVITSASIRKRVVAARARQRLRFGEDSTKTNARMSVQEIEAFCPLDSRCQALMEQAFLRMDLSARAYQRLRKVARTIADLDGCDEIQEKHLAEAIRYRSLSILGEADL